jgi:hypothetical protein
MAATALFMAKWGKVYLPVNHRFSEDRVLTAGAELERVRRGCRGKCWHKTLQVPLGSFCHQGERIDLPLGWFRPKKYDSGIER